ncbi:hypothetical protein [Flaviaesturariibacter amylovorans]|uniref:PorZ N-terminal beta-propeller domain-containing protein n=1 Tax=Flaviaesturariibacter amylovorans TaxID=1084520 RepID=A0ABP8GA50_9BACT
MRFLPFLLLSGLSAAAQNTFPAIGSWREHLPYNSTVDLAVTPERIYAATPYSLFTVDRESGEVERRSKVGGLSETGIRTIRYDEGAGKLYIGYTNSNIDVLTTGGIRNIPDLLRESVSGDKTVYDFFPAGDVCYVATGLGIWVLDAERYETKDSWFIGNNGGYVPTYMVSRDNEYIWAATAEGLKRTPRNNATPSDFRTWETVSGTGGLPAGRASGVAVIGGRTVALARDTVFVRNGNSWTLFYANGDPIVSINATEGRLAVAQSFVLGGSSTRVTVLNADGSVARTATNSPVLSYPQEGALAGPDLWVADLYGGLSRWNAAGVEQFKPNGPDGIATGEMTVYNGTLWAAAGSVNESWNYQYNRNGVYQYKEGQWTNYNQFRLPGLDTVMDVLTVAVDPRDESLWAGSYGGGLVHYTGPGTYSIFKQNSPIGPTVGDPTSYRVAGLAFDQNNNLWVANYGAINFLHVRKTDGTWSSFAAPFFLNENAAASIVVDNSDQLWILSPKGNGVLAYNHGASIESAGDDRWRLFRSGAGNGNLPAGEPLCLAKDRSGFIWVGTTDGVAVIQCAESVFFGGCEATLPIVKGETNFANYLFKGEEVRSIAVDGADRKWVGTRNGLWLISPDGDARLAHFTEENSPLLSNDIKRVAIDGRTGEVFVSTAKGICSFRAGATEGVETYDSLKVFPNPVPPGYGGTIAIRGLKENSIVKIAELNGRLVYQTRSLGGQAVWNGRDYAGRSIASGVYLVLVTDEGQEERTAGKIVVIGR